MSWNTRPKLNFGGQAAAPTPTHWRQASPGNAGGLQHRPYEAPTDQGELDESMAYLQQYISRPSGHPPGVHQYDASPFSGAAAFQQRGGPPSSGHVAGARTPSYLQNSPGGAAAYVSTPASRLAQPKGNANLQQWIASREGSLSNQQQWDTQQQQRGPAAAPHNYQSHDTFDPVTIHTAAPPPPALSAPAGALVEPPQQLVGGPRRNMVSPNSVVQQTIAAQQLAMLAHRDSVAQHQQGPSASPFHGMMNTSGWEHQQAPPPPPASAPPAHAFSAAPSPDRQPLFRANDHDGNLVLIATYLKNHYGREVEESGRGIESMEPEDVLGLVQCFYIDAYRLIRTLRDQSSVGRGTFTTTDPNTGSIVPIVDSAEKKPKPQQQVQQQQQQQQQQQPLPPTQRASPSPQPQSQLMQNINPQQQVQQQQQESQSQPQDAFPTFGSTGTDQSQYQPQSQYHQRTMSEMQRSSSAQPPQHQYPTQQAYAQQQPFVDAQQPQQLVSSTGSAAGRGGGLHQHHHHARGPSNHRRELSLEQQLRDIPRRVGVSSVPLKIGMPQLRAGAMMLKYCRKGPPHLRYFSVQDRTSLHKAQETVLPHLTWAASINGKSAGQMSLLTLDEVLVGPVGPNAQRFTKNNLNVVVDDNKKPVDENMCFTLIFAERTLELCALTETEYTTFVGTLQSVVARNREMRSGSTDGLAGPGR